MFIALSLKDVGAPAERNVLWRVSYMPLLTERKYFYFTRAINILLLRSKDSKTESDFFGQAPFVAPSHSEDEPRAYLNPPRLEDVGIARGDAEVYVVNIDVW